MILTKFNNWSTKDFDRRGSVEYNFNFLLYLQYYNVGNKKENSNTLTNYLFKLNYGCKSLTYKRWQKNNTETNEK